MKKVCILILVCAFINTAAFGQSPHAAQLYGMTEYGGNSSKGSIFHYTPSTNDFTTDYQFQVKVKGKTPKCEIVTSNNGKYYGTTTAGGDYNAGVLFQWDSVTNVYNDLYNFTGSDGKDARGGMLLYNNKLYGMTNEGGANNYGVIYEWDIAANVYTKKIDLDSANGKNPTGSLTLLNNIFYGFTSSGGAHDKGVLFEWNPATNIYTKKFDFDSIKGSNPVGKLAPFNGKFYAMCNKGGAYDVGTIYQWDYSNNTVTKTFDFNNTNGAFPMGYLTLYNNKFYGVTNEGGIYQTSFVITGILKHYGIIFEYNPVNNAFSKKKDLGFQDGNRGPLGSLALKGNVFWGATSEGNYQSGSIFSWNPATNVLAENYFFYGATTPCELDRPSIGTHPFESFLWSGDYLLGTTSEEAGNLFGTVYKFYPDSNQIIGLVNMEATDGSYPKGSLTKLGNKLYGLTYQGGNSHAGNIFEWDLDTQQYTERLQFDGYTTGFFPKGSLTFYNGKFYGINSFGKSYRETSNNWNNWNIRALGDYFSWDPSTNVYQSLLSANYARATPVLFNNKLYSTTEVSSGLPAPGAITAYNPSTNTLTDVAYLPGNTGYYNNYQDMVSANGVTYYNGKFYGMTPSDCLGCLELRGTIYEWDTLTTVMAHRLNFVDSIGTYPTGNLLLVNNEFYGLTTNTGNYSGNYPCLFKWNPVTNVLEKKASFNGAAFGTPVYSGGKIYFLSEASYLDLYEYDPILDTIINVHSEPISLFGVGGGWNYNNCRRPPSYQQLLEIIPNKLPQLLNTPAAQTLCANLTNEATFTISDTDLDTMQFQFTSSNIALIPVANISITNINSNYTLHYAPATNQSGTATITVTANDGYGGSVNFSFNITIHALPVVSSISTPAPATVCEGESIILNGTGAATYTWSNGIINNTGFTPPVGTTIYTVTGTDANGCSNTNTQTVVVTQPALPSIAITSNVTQGSSGDPVVYTATTNLISPYGINWYRNNVFQTSTTTNTWSTTIVSGNNSVKAIIGAPAQCLQPDSATSNLVEFRSIEGINVYPNPTRGEVIITGLMPYDDIGLYNSIGQRLLTTNGNNIISDQNKLNLGGFASGTYILSIKRNEGIFVKKIVKLSQ